MLRVLRVLAASTGTSTTAHSTLYRQLYVCVRIRRFSAHLCPHPRVRICVSIRVSAMLFLQLSRKQRSTFMLYLRTTDSIV